MPVATRVLVIGVTLTAAASTACAANASGESFTVGAWVRLPSADDAWMLRRPYSFCSRGSRQTGYRFVLGSQDGKPEFTFCGTNGLWQGLRHSRTGAQAVLKLDTWMHFAGVYENGTMTLYFDGRPLAATSVDMHPPSVAVGWALTSGHGYWWFLLFGNNSFHDETIMTTVRECAELCAKRPALPRKAEVAFFSPVYVRRRGGTLRADLVQELVNHTVPTCGVPVDAYELADLANPNLPDYKAYLVAGTDESMPVPAHAGVKTLRVRTGHDRPTVAGLRNFFEQAGAHVWCRSGDVFSAGCGFAMIHAVNDGEKTISLPAEYGSAEWRGAMRRGETRILDLSPFRK